MDPAFRHVARCNDAVLPGGRMALEIDGAPVGWVAPHSIEPVRQAGAVPRGDGLTVPPAALQPMARALAAQGLCRWRNEAFDVRALPDGPALAQVDRGALPLLGIMAAGVHLNGLVLRGGAPWLWVARRAADKLLDPGKLDHLVAGGIPAGLTPAAALRKEAAEEAGLPTALLHGARQQGVIDYRMTRNEGLRRDRLHCFDVVLPESFTPEPRDGEVESFALWPLAEVLERVRWTDDFKFNVPLVLLPLFQRYGLLA